MSGYCGSDLGIVARELENIAREFRAGKLIEVSVDVNVADVPPRININWYERQRQSRPSDNLTAKEIALIDREDD